MTVKQLVKELLKFEPHAKVVVVVRKPLKGTYEAEYLEGPDPDMGGASEYFEIELGHRL